MNCILCSRKSKDKLCLECNKERMLAASMERLWQNTGLTYSNAEKYSIENWIKNEKGRKEENQ